MLAWFSTPNMSPCFQRLIKTYYLLLAFLKTCQSVLIRNIRFLAFSFITTTVDDVHKNRYQHNISYSTYLSVGHWVRLSSKMLRYDNLANPESSQWNPSSKLFWLTSFWVDNIQLLAHHKKVLKTNQNQSIITKKFNVILQGKGYYGLPWSWWDTAAHQRLINITGLISKFIGVKFKYSLGAINYSMF